MSSIGQPTSTDSLSHPSNSASDQNNTPPDTSTSSESSASAPAPAPTSVQATQSSSTPADPTTSQVPTTPHPTIKSTDTTLLASVTDSASSTSTVTVIITPSPSPSGGQRSASHGVTGAASNNNHAGAIVGGVIGGLALILIALAAAVLIRRHRRAMRTAPSAEFMDIARRGGLKGSPSPGPATVHLDSSMSPTGDRLIPLARQSSLEDDERPPAFTSGSYSDPVFEKVQAAAEMREQYRQRESYTAALRLDTGGGAGSVTHGSDEKSGGYGYGL
ncbi:hypothetical protein PYCCODRAFT_1425857 [Trametes coccinea BRFM310]|uniref:REJ domain-containing protein n=1 Tax=Trametes coccinea (strain BRFM310) TaxID=1353009 RepID=A0A1Y2IKI0_TRAC3|nr:hypothetical protein PYCCODRAFT_1425857 [Trametes coccinea BRFM310]